MANPSGAEFIGPAPNRSTYRPRIYPHRSVRGLEIPASRVLYAFALAALLTFIMAHWAVEWMDLHRGIATHLMHAAEIPEDGLTSVAVFPGLEPAQVPITPVPTFETVSEGARWALILCVVVLLIVSRRFVLTHNLSMFLIFLLFVSTVLLAIHASFQFQSGYFGQIWLRNQLLVWFVLPWISALLFIVTQPSAIAGTLWTLASQVWAFLFSAMRMVFCLGVLHYSGLLFFPLLWFGLGTLSDILIVLLFYSLSIHLSGGRLSDRRPA